MQHTGHAAQVSILRMEQVEGDGVLTSDPESSETQIRRYNTHHLELVFLQSEQSLEWGDVPP